MQEEYKIPLHVAIIMDGNGRWATARGLNRSKGHEKGYQTLKKITKYILNRGIKILTVYAFSTENFKRSKEEVDFLMKLFIKGFKKDSKYFQKENIKVIFSGKDEPLKKEVLEAMHTLENDTKNNTNGILNICLNYGGRTEIVDAVNKIINDNVHNITEEKFNNYLYHNLPDVDLLIRTSGEYRISNFLLWQISYAEMCFPKCYFPDFDEKEFEKCLDEYNHRDRRFGNVK